MHALLVYIFPLIPKSNHIMWLDSISRTTLLNAISRVHMDTTHYWLYKAYLLIKSSYLLPPAGAKFQDNVKRVGSNYDRKQRKHAFLQCFKVI